MNYKLLLLKFQPYSQSVDKISIDHFLSKYCELRQIKQENFRLYFIDGNSYDVWTPYLSNSTNKC